MKINVRSFAMIREFLGSREVSITINEGSSVADGVFTLTKNYPETTDYIYENDKIKSILVLILNEEKIDPLNFTKTILHENDTLVILPPAGGG